jgi:hypothetical protein
MVNCKKNFVIKIQQQPGGSGSGNTDLQASKVILHVTVIVIQYILYSTTVHTSCNICMYCCTYVLVCTRGVECLGVVLLPFPPPSWR